MKSAFTFFLLFTPFSHATVTPLFSSDGTKVNLVIQGNDLDANKLYEALNVAPTEENNTQIKSIVAQSSNDFIANIYEITCKKSTLVNNLSSCSLVIDSKYSWASVNLENQSASVFSNGFIDTLIAHSNFIVPDNQNIIFKSKNSDLVIGVIRSALGEIFRFRIQYNEL